MTTKRQSAKLAAVAARAQLQQEMMDEEEVVGVAPTTLPPKKSAMAKPSTSTFAVNDEVLLLDESILPASPPPLNDDVVSGATRISPTKRIAKNVPFETPSPSPNTKKRVSDDSLTQLTSKVARTGQKPSVPLNRLFRKLSPVEEAMVSSDELIEMDLQSCISTMSLKEKKELLKPGMKPKKQVTDSKTFERACQLAAKDPAACVKRLVQLAKGNIDALVEFAGILMKEPVGIIGSRRQLRVAAMRLLDIVLEIHSDHTGALCMKGEMLMPRQFFGTGHPETPYSTLELAYAYFAKADILGSQEGRFQRGRWLVAMAPVHESDAKVREGMRYVDEAASAGHARAYVFKAQVYEFPDRYGLKGRKRKATDNKMVVKWYMKAAEMGEGNAMNDIGSSYATKFGGLPYDFDEAVKYYVRAIKAGCLTAFENLGTHYETGMSGNAPDRVDYEKAMHYYRGGMEMRCCKCTYNIASAYDEGLGSIVKQDWEMAEEYYRHCIILAYDDEDEVMKVRAERALIALYICRLKLSEAGSEQAEIYIGKLNGWLNRRMLAGTLMEVNKCLMTAMDCQDMNQLEDLLGMGAGSVYDAALLIGAEVRDHDGENELSPDIKEKLKHMFGTCAEDVEIIFRSVVRKKRRRVSS